MSNRLPIPGGDNGDWGNILNAFLEVSLYNDPNNSSDPSNGTLNSNVVGTAQIQNNAVTNAQLDIPTQTTLASVASKYVKPGSGIPSTDMTSAVQTNLTSASTAVQPGTTLSGGDLSGTISSPTVAKLQGIPVTPGTPANNQVLTYSTGSGGEWTPATVSSTTVSNATTSAPGIVQLAGDLGGAATSATAPTIANTSNVQSVVNTIISTNTNVTDKAPLASPTFTGKVTTPALQVTTGSGTANQVLTSDASGNATWVTPASGVGLDSTSTDIQPDTTTGSAVAGSSSLAAKADHQHALVAHDHSTTNKGGQITPSTGLAVSSGSPSSTTYLRGDNTWSTPAAGVSLDSTNTDIQALGSQSAGSSSLAAKADHVHPTTGLVTTSTSLGGDLSGTAGSATVAKIQGTTVSAPAGGATAYLNASGTWTTPSGAGNMSSSTYDPAGIAQQVVGTTATQTLTNKSISGSQITSAVANATNAVNATNATTATTASTVTTIPALTGDVTSNGSTNATTVAKIQGTTVSAPSGGATSFLNANGTWTTPSGTGAQALIPTAVKTSAYTANAGDFIPVDTSSGSVVITLPTTPATGTRVEIKMINTAVNTTNGYGNNTVTFNVGGSDVINKAGTTSGTIELLNQAVMLQYNSTNGVWYVQSDDLPLSSTVSGISHTVTTTYSVVASDHVIMADATSAAFTITLPTAVGFNGILNIEAITSTTNQITLATTSSQTIEGSSTTSLGTGSSGALYSAVTLASDGANWRIL